MAIDKDPSIYRDRGTIGSSDELDEYGVWVKSEPQVMREEQSKTTDGIEPVLPDIEDLPDLEVDMTDTSTLEPAEEQVPDFSDLPSFSIDESESEEGPFTELSLGDFLDKDENPAAAVEEIPDMDIDLGLDDEISVELSASEGLAETEEPSAVDALETRVKEQATRLSSVKPDLSTELLMRIADELSSIKKELTSLKGELTVLKSAEKGEAPMEAGEKETPHGFFDEEDDEKIALTGDELDNILNTADFTEEAGADAGIELENEPEEIDFSPELLSDKPDILGEEPEISLDVIEPEAQIEEEIVSEVEEEIAFEPLEALTEEDIAFEPIELEPQEESEELAELRESGVVPMTPAPEDTSYLEEEEVVESIGEEPHLDLSDAVIDEPDLGDLVLEEAPIEEPSIDSIDIDLDLEESLHSEDISLPEDKKEESFEAVLPEGFVVESGSPEEDVDLELDVPEEIEEATESELEENFETPEAAAPEPSKPSTSGSESASLPQNIRQEVKTVLSYMDQLLESLPESKIEEFAKSEYFDTYKKLFEELGIA